MPIMKTTRKYYFSVEGETEKWYLDWLQKIINNEPSSRYKVSIDNPIQKNPLKRAKSLNSLSKIDIRDGSKQGSILTVAIQSGSLEIVKLLVNHGVNLEYSDGSDSILFTAYYSNSNRILEYLILKGININKKNGDGMTILMLATYDNLDVVKLLVKYNADLKVKYQNKVTALDMAKTTNNKEIIKVLEDAEMT